VYAITKTFRFSAAHHLPHLPSEHKCWRQHGHNYSVTVRVECDQLDERGFVIDFAELDQLGDWLKRMVDHRDLNEVFKQLEGDTTAEHLAGLFATITRDVAIAHRSEERGVSVVMVRVCETDDSCAEWWE
jgi:6-pyruvoyltetrahydropterin/6-carboxytetrahydropterin synthase